MDGAVIMQGLFYLPEGVAITTSAGPKQPIPVQQNRPNPDKETKCGEDHLTPEESHVSELPNESLKCDSSAAPIFTVGSTSAHMDTCCQITSDKNILTSVSGYKIEYGPSVWTFTFNSVHEPDEFILNVFLREKKDGSYRMIFNLKNLNQRVAYHHFKMHTIQTCISLIFSIPVHARH